MDNVIEFKNPEDDSLKRLRAIKKSLKKIDALILELNELSSLDKSGNDIKELSLVKVVKMSLESKSGNA